MTFDAPTLFTIGHSTRSADAFLALLREHGVRLLVDVRRYPGSRRHPHFDRDALADALAAHGIRYLHEADLGGRRELRPGPENAGLRSRGFRAYADHMRAAPFRAALERLIDAARSAPTAVMCAEAVPWRCHRWLLSDAATAAGASVVHILRPGASEGHTLNPEAVVGADGRVTYPARRPGQPELFEDARDSV